ncbi:hypothetical protein ACIPQ3_06885 [Streptomyces albidoflavus]
MVHLAMAAREQGRAADALLELDALVGIVETRAREARATRQDMMLLAVARVAVGVALGDLLPEAHLGLAALWAASGAELLSRLEGEPSRLAHALRMQGNELRKAGRLEEAVTTLQRARVMSPDLKGKATTSLLLARAASETGDVALLTQSVEHCRQALEQEPDIASFFLNPFSLREVELRGLLLTSSGKAAERVATRAPSFSSPPPAWTVMERVTMAHFHLVTDDKETAAANLRGAIHDARSLHLPHQIERAVRLARTARLDDLVDTGTEVLRTMPTLPSRTKAGPHQPR